eukprot:809836-Amphidinium_carterae.1
MKVSVRWGRGYRASTVSLPFDVFLRLSPRSMATKQDMKLHKHKFAAGLWELFLLHKMILVAFGLHWLSWDWLMN